MMATQKLSKFQRPEQLMEAVIQGKTTVAAAQFLLDITASLKKDFTSNIEGFRLFEVATITPNTLVVLGRTMPDAHARWPAGIYPVNMGFVYHKSMYTLFQSRYLSHAGKNRGDWLDRCEMTDKGIDIEFVINFDGSIYTESEKVFVPFSKLMSTEKLKGKSSVQLQDLSDSPPASE